MAKIAINGFGRIGRLFFRQAWDSDEIEIAAINDLGSPEQLSYFLKYDTVYGIFKDEVNYGDDYISINGDKIPFHQVKNPSDLPWDDLDIDVVVEATGVFTEYDKAKMHLEAGAKKVVITAPADDKADAGKTILMGINEGDLEKFNLSSNGSCTTNAAAPLIQILNKKPGIEKAILNTVHGYTASQNLVDSTINSSKLRRGRAAAQNIVPSSTGSAVAVGRAIPEMIDRFDGIAMRVPVVAGSIADITFISKKNTTVEEVNSILKEAAKEDRWKKVFKVTEDPIVSSDIIGEPYGAIADLSFTRVVDGNLVKVLSWYDNEFGYVSTLVNHVENVTYLI